MYITLRFKQATVLSMGRVETDEEGCLPFQFPPITLHGTTAIKGLMIRKIKHGQVTFTERKQVTHNVPHHVRRERLVRSHALREASAFRNKKVEIIYQVSSVKVVRPLLSPYKNLPISAFLNSCFLMLIKGETH
jgi:hypothetical protein